MTSIITPNDPGYWKMQITHLEFQKRELVKALEKLADHVKNGSVQETLNFEALFEAQNVMEKFNLAFVEAKNVIDNVASNSPAKTTAFSQSSALVTKEDEHRDDTVAAIHGMVEPEKIFDFSDAQVAAIHDAIALIEGENG